MATDLIDEEAVAQFHDEGYVVLRQAFDPSALSAEVDDALERGLRDDGEVKQGSGGVEFRVVVMMCERTPVSLALLDACAALASKLMGRPVLPGRAKGTRYFGSSGFHADSDVAIPSLSFVAYLEPVDAASGALRVIPGSHRQPSAGTAPDAIALATNPGDVIVFDEHLTHGSEGGAVRRQWRVDFTVEPRNDAEHALVYETYAKLFDVEWDAGDDVDLYPSYGPYWQRLDRPWTTKLGAMGVYELAERHAAAVRERRV